MTNFGANPNLTWAYIAGFFDGEGCAGIYQRNPKHNSGRVILCSIAQKAVPVLEAIRAFLSVQGISANLNPQRGRGPNPIGVLQISAKQAVKFLNAVLPYLVVKKVIVQDLLRYDKIFPPFTRQQCGRLSGEAKRAQIRGHRSHCADLKRAS